MKKIYKIFLLFAGLTAGIFTACTDDFAELNTNPKSLPKVNPEQMLYTATTNWVTSDHAWIGWASKTRWMQYGVSIWGYGPNGYTYFIGRIGDHIYDEYVRMGGIITNMAYLASQTDNPSAYDNMNAVSRILLIAKGIQTSDLFGSLIYSEGWQARNGKSDEADLLPAFQTQEELVGVWDAELKSSIATLKASATGQVSLAGYDRSYNGDVKKWVKAGNAIRLRLASRLLSRQPDKAKSIAAEVLGSPESDLMSGADDSFIFWYDVLYTNIHGGDWHSSRDMLIASRALMNYLNKNEDPRKRIFFRINNLTPENIADYNANIPSGQKAIPADWGRWMGASASRADWNAKDSVYSSRTLRRGTESVDMRPANSPQARIWKGNDNGGSGGNWAPVMTCADFCFLAAEFVLQNKIQSAKTAQEWYENGIRTSLKQWNDLGKYCDLYDYAAMTETETTTFMNQPDVKWDESKALEQIRAQAWVDHYRNTDESWAQWKRTSYPNKNAMIITFDECFPVETEPAGVVPRRVKFSYPNEGVHNEANLKQRLDKMSEDPDFGAIDNEWGRFWWDKK